MSGTSRRLPAVGTALRPGLGACDRLGETRVLGVRQAVGAALDVARDHLHPGGDEHVPLPRPDRVHGHPGRLQAGRAVAGDGRAGHLPAEQRGHDPGHVEALLATGEPAAEQQVVDLRRVELRHLRHRGRTIVAVRSSGRSSVMAPLKARPMGLRAAATMTASGMAGSPVDDALGRGSRARGYPSCVRGLLVAPGLSLLIRASTCTSSAPLDQRRPPRTPRCRPEVAHRDRTATARCGRQPSLAAKDSSPAGRGDGS
jgi:hypothetical protein